MPSIKLTERAVEKLPAPDPSGKPRLHWDSEMKGFGVLCSGKTNTKTYVVQRTLPNGVNRRVTVEQVNKVALQQARADGAELLAAMRKGIDPKARAKVTTLRDALENYLRRYEAKLRPNSITNYRWMIEHHLESWLDRPLTVITRDAVEKLHGEIAKRIAEAGRSNGWTSANAAMRVLRLLWNDARDKNPTLPENPVRLRKLWFDEPRRERIVEHDELPAFYAAVNQLPSAVARHYLLFVLFTGLRRREAASLKWDYVDFDKKVIHIPAEITKARRKLDLPMSDLVRNLLVERRSFTEASDYVFPSIGKAGYIAEPRFPLEAVAKACLVGVSVHDLRRTFITLCEEVEISPMAMKALVNHSLGSDVTEGYVQMRIERLRAPVQRVADRIKELCEIRPTDGKNVVAM